MGLAKAKSHIFCFTKLSNKVIAYDPYIAKADTGIELVGFPQLLS
ncbi:unnamed protein product, partial [marine sediment metagenome]